MKEHQESKSIYIGYALLGLIAIGPIVALFVVITTPLGIMPWSVPFDNASDWFFFIVIGAMSAFMVYALTWQIIKASFEALGGKG